MREQFFAHLQQAGVEGFALDEDVEKKRTHIGLRAEGEHIGLGVRLHEPNDISP